MQRLYSVILYTGRARFLLHFPFKLAAMANGNLSLVVGVCTSVCVVDSGPHLRRVSDGDAAPVRKKRVCAWASAFLHASGSGIVVSQLVIGMIDIRFCVDAPLVGRHM